MILYAKWCWLSCKRRMENWLWDSTTWRTWGNLENSIYKLYLPTPSPQFMIHWYQCPDFPWETVFSPLSSHMVWVGLTSELSMQSQPGQSTEPLGYCDWFRDKYATQIGPMRFIPKTHQDLSFQEIGILFPLNMKLKRQTINPEMLWSCHTNHTARLKMGLT